jgi:hypothetical protein
MDTIELIKIQDMINDLYKKIQAMTDSKIVQPESHSSADIKELATALAKAQAEFEVAAENKSNPFFKSAYADLMSVVQASRPSLTKNGLSVMQIITDNDEGKWLTTKLMHTSGEWVQSKVRIVPPKNDVQSISSTITYMKRMCYVSLVGVVVGDEDDDGEASVATSRDTFAKGVALNTKYNAREDTTETITKEQLEELNLELAEYPDVAEMVLDGLKIQNLADIPRSKYFPALKRIREIKDARNNPRK